MGYAYRERDSSIDENDYRDSRVTFTLDIEKAYVSKPKSI